MNEGVNEGVNEEFLQTSVDQKHLMLHHISEKLPQNPVEIFVYGAGLFGRTCCSFLRQKYASTKLCFVDARWKSLKEVDKIPVISWEDCDLKEHPLVVAMASFQKELFFKLFQEEQVPLEQLYFFSALNPKNYPFSPQEQYICSLQDAGQWLQGICSSTKIPYFSDEKRSPSFPLPKVQHYTQKEQGRFLLEEVGKLSVIVPVYQVESYLESSISSILGQTYQNLEVILIDDGSTDNCPQLCDGLAEKDARVKVIHQENRGTGYCRNRGLSLVTGEFITFCDSDDYLHPQAYEIALTSLVQTSCEFVEFHHKKTTVKESFSDITSFSSYQETGEEGLYSIAAGLFHYSAVWNKVYRRELLEGIVLPENKIFDDEFFTNILYTKAKSMVTIPLTLYYYVQRESSCMHKTFDIRRVEPLEACVLRYLQAKEQNVTKEFQLGLLVHCLQHLRYTIGEAEQTTEKDGILKRCADVLLPIEQEVAEHTSLSEGAKNFLALFLKKHL